MKVEIKGKIFVKIGPGRGRRVPSGRPIDFECKKQGGGRQGIGVE